MVNGMVLLSKGILRIIFILIIEGLMVILNNYSLTLKLSMYSKKKSDGKLFAIDVTLIE